MFLWSSAGASRGGRAFKIKSELSPVVVWYLQSGGGGGGVEPPTVSCFHGAAVVLPRQTLKGFHPVLCTSKGGDTSV